jgi:DNA-directed RNA polymerase specialized sigma24 family protein
MNTSTQIRKIVNDTVMKCELSSSEIDELVMRVTKDFSTRCPDFVKCLTICHSLPLIERQSQKYFKKRYVSDIEADELSGQLTENIFETLLGRWPKNPNAWLKTIRRNKLANYCRDNDRKKKRFGSRLDSDHLLVCEDRSDSNRKFERFIADLPDEERRIVQRLHRGDEWKDICTDIGITPEEGEAVVQRIEWPDGGSPRSRRCRKTRPH